MNDSLIDLNPQLVQEMVARGESLAGEDLSSMNLSHLSLAGADFSGAVLNKANFANSDALQTVLTKKEQTIIADLGPWLLKHGIHFVGLDLIDEQLTEINITCPTGIVQISEIEGRRLSEEIVEYFIDLIKKS